MSCRLASSIIIPAGHHYYYKDTIIKKWIFKYDENNLLRKVILPAALPHITNGLRLSIQLIFLVTPVAEMIMGDVGLGGFIWKSADLFKTDLVILGQLTLGFMGLSLFKIFDFLEKRYFLFWMQIGEAHEA